MPINMRTYAMGSFYEVLTFFISSLGVQSTTAKKEERDRDLFHAANNKCDTVIFFQINQQHLQDKKLLQKKNKNKIYQ